MPHHTNEYAGHAKHYSLFLDAAKFLCDGLGINFQDEKIDSHKSDKGSTYIIRVEGKHILDFSLNTFVKENKLQEVRTHVGIGYDKGSAPFCEYEDIVEHINEDDYLIRWVTQAMHNINLKHSPVDLDALFSTTEIRVYGTYSDPILALKEMEILLNGMQFSKMSKPIVYRFRHVDGLTRTFSYCVFVSGDRGPNFWAFFHKMGGLDSGGYSKSLEIVEAMIATNPEPDLRPVDIEYARLHKFLAEHVTTFDRVRRNTLFFDLNHVGGDFGQTFSESYSKFLESYDNGEYSRVLRDLRTLLQTAMEIVCEKKSIAIPDKPNISKLCSLLVKEGVLDEKTTTWYCAFSSVANTPAHRELPTSNDGFLDENVEERTKMTILLGTQLINELGSTIEWMDDLDDGSYDDSNGNVL